MIIATGERYSRLLWMTLVSGLLLFRSDVQMMAQITTAGVEGTITDEGGAVIPGVSVRATGLSTGFTRAVVSDDSGRFRCFELPIGTYTLTAEKTGFKKYEQHGFGPLSAGQLARLDIVMGVGSDTETVQVQGTAPLLQTDSSAVSTPIYEDQLDNLPINSRSPVQLLLQQPGAQVALQFTDPGTGSEYLGFNFNGQNYVDNDYLVDGTDATVVSDQTNDH